MKKIYTTLLLLIILILPGCSSELVLQDINFVYHQLRISKLPEQKDYPESDAVIILDLTSNQVVAKDNHLVTYMTRHVIKKIFRNASEQSIVRIYLNGDEELTGIQARTITPDGKIINLKPEDFYTLSGASNSNVLYANVKTIRFTFPAVDKNCVIEYKYEKKENNPFVYDIWQIQNNLPTLRNQYSITMPKIMLELLPYNYETYPGKRQIKPVADTNQILSAGLGDPVTFTWARSNVPAFEEEEMMPPAQIVTPQVRFALASWNGWSGIAGWYHKNFFKSRLVMTDSLKMLAHQITDSSKTVDEKIKNIYNYVQKIRYVEIQLGQTGLQPTLPQTVLDRKYGDCKDKSILCIALLKAIKIKAMPVLVLTADNGFIEKGFPYWNFNHMIVKAQDSSKTYWMDPTSEFSPLGTLPWQDQGINVLTVYSDSTGGLETTPMPNYSHNSSDVNVNISLLNNSARFNVNMNFKGEQARSYRAVFSEKSENEIKEFFKKIWLRDATGAELDSIRIKYLSELDSALTINLDFHIDDALQQQGEFYYFNPNLFKINASLKLTSDKKRKYPIWFPTGFVIQRSTKIHIADSSLVFASYPETVSFQHSDFSYSKYIQESRPSEIKSNELFLMKHAILPSSEYRVIKHFFQDVNKSLGRPVFLKRKK